MLLYLTFIRAAVITGNKGNVPRKYILKKFSLMKWYAIICSCAHSHYQNKANKTTAKYPYNRFMKR